MKPDAPDHDRGGLAALAAGVAWLDPERAGSVAEELATAGWHVGTADLTDAEERPAMIDRLAQALVFPDWTGRNLDALYDAATDLSWLADQDVAVIVTNEPVDDAAWLAIRGVLVDAAAWWQSEPRRFLTLIVR